MRVSGGRVGSQTGRVPLGGGWALYTMKRTGMRVPRVTLQVLQVVLVCWSFTVSTHNLHCVPSGLAAAAYALRHV
jgi:hypothetical protein